MHVLWLDHGAEEEYEKVEEEEKLNQENDQEIMVKDET